MTWKHFWQYAMTGEGKPGAWETYLQHVPDKELDRIIGLWERALALPWYDEGSYGRGSLERALEGAYALRDKRRTK